jgi:hypothetical protein
MSRIAQDDRERTGRVLQQVAGDAALAVLADPADVQRHFRDPHALAEQVNERFLRVGELAEEGQPVSGLTIEGAEAAGDVGELRSATDPVDDACDDPVADKFHQRHLRPQLGVGEARAGDEVCLTREDRADQRFDVGGVELAVAVDVDDDVGPAAHGAFQAGLEDLP